MLHFFWSSTRFIGSSDGGCGGSAGGGGSAAGGGGGVAATEYFAAKALGLNTLLLSYKISENL